MGLWTPGQPSMPLTEREKQVILEEAEKAKELGYCRRIEEWVDGVLAAVDFQFKIDKDQLKARLDPDPITHEVLNRGGKPLTKRQTGV